MAIDFAALAARLLSQSPAVLFEWYPAGKLHGHEFKVGDVHGTEGESLSINVQTGKWADFAAGLQGGDLISLYAAREGIGNAEAARALDDRPAPPPTPKAKQPKKEEWTPIAPVPGDAPAPPDEYWRRRASGKDWDKLTVAARWAYTDASGGVVGYACRLEWIEPDGTAKKDVVPQVYCSNEEGKRQWRWKALPQPRPLYNLRELHERHDAPVMVVEGEKKVEALRKLAPQYVGVAWQGGCAAWRKTNWKELRGRNVVLWPDADDPGAKAMWEIGHELLKHCPSVKVIVINDATRPQGWDAADAVAEGWDWERFKRWALPQVVQLNDGGTNGTGHERKPEADRDRVVGEVEDQARDQSHAQERRADAVGDRERAAQADQRAAGGPGRDGAGGGDERGGDRQARDGDRDAGGVSQGAPGVSRRHQLSPGADASSPAAAQSQVKRWLDWSLERNGNGVPITNLSNAMRVLEQDPQLRGLVWFDEFLGRVLTGQPAREWGDNDTTELTYYIQTGVGISKMGMEMVNAAVIAIAKRNVRNCVRDYIEAIKWDNESRVESFMTKVFHCEDNVYSRAVSRNFWVSILARVMHPGAKVDNMVVLEGSQGLLKSSAIEAIASPWFAEQHESATQPKAFAEVLQGKLIVEVSEMDAFSRAEVNTIKKVVSCRVDRYRASYARFAADHPRQGIMMGSTNKDDWNRDETGARRFWPIRCVGQADIAHVIEHRDQLYAEALAMLRAGATWWEMPEEETRTEQRKRYDADPWITPISDYLIGRDSVTVNEVAGACLEIATRDLDRSRQMRIAGCLRALGWVNNGNTRRSGKVIKLWMPGSDQYGEREEKPEVATEVATQQNDIPFQ